MKHLIYLTAIILIQQTLFSQEIRKRTIELGTYGLLGNNIHNSKLIDEDLEELNYCCPNFLEGSGFGWEIGLYAEFPINKYFAISLRPSIRDLSGTLEFNERLDRVNVNGVPQIGESKHTLETRLLSGGTSLFIDYEPIYLLSISTGLRAATIFTNDFDYVERVTKPSNAIFREEGRKTRNPQSGEFEDISPFLLSLEFSIAYSIPLDETHNNFLTPEIYYSKMLSNVLTDSEWKIDFFAFGISYRFNLLNRTNKNTSPLEPN